MWGIWYLGNILSMNGDIEIGQNENVLNVAVLKYYGERIITEKTGEENIINMFISCTYDFGNHADKKVFEQCEQCYQINGIITPLCSSCGFRFEDMKLCNDCWMVLTQKETKWETDTR